MIASRVVYPPNGGPLDESQPARAASPTGSPMASSPPTRIRTSGIFTRRLSLTAASVANTVASSSLFGSSPPSSNPSSIYQQSSFFRSSSIGLNSAAASSSSINVSSSANNISSTAQSSGSGQAATGSTTSTSSGGRQRTRSTSHPPPPKYKSYRTPQLRISLQDVIGNLVLSAPVMAPGESIRGQIHLELPKATPVHSIEVCLTGTVTALDGTRLGSMKTVTILDECKTVATASITNTRTNTTRRHTTPSPSATASAATGANAATANGQGLTTTSTTITSSSVVAGQRGRRGSIVAVNSPATTDRASRSPTFPPSAGSIAAAVSTAAAITIAAQGNSRRYSTELMSRTLSMPSTYYAQGSGYQTNNGSTLSLNNTNRPVSPTPADLRGRRTSFSANVDAPLVGGAAFSSLLGTGRGNMSMVNISTLSQFPLGDAPDPSEPEAPSYDPPNYEGIFTSTSARSSTEEAGSASSVTSTEVVSAPVTMPVTSSPTTEEPPRAEESNSTSVSAPLTTTDENAAATPVSASIPTPSPSHSADDVRTNSSRSSRDGRNDTTPTAATTTTITPAAPAAEPVEPKAVLMQPGNYVIPFSIRIPANSTMSLPGSFTDPIGNISYQLKAVMKQILPSPDPYNPRALVVEPTFTSSTQIIKLIPMNDPAYMPLYNMPFETESVRANVGAWVWSTGFLEAHAWVPKQGYRPGRMVPLVIHIVNHSDARQVVVETTLCKCLHYGSGLSSARAALGIAGQNYLMDTGMQAGDGGVVEEGSVSPTVSAFAEGHVPIPEDATSPMTTETGRERRRRSSRRSSTTRNSRQQPPPPATVMPSPPASPYGSTFPSTPTSEQGGESPEGSVHGVTAGASASAAAAARMASPNSMASISSQWGSIHSSSSDGNSNGSGSGSGGANGSSGAGGQVAAAIQAFNNMSNTTINSNGGIQYNPDTLRSSMTSPTPSTKNTVKELSVGALPIIQHQREKLTKSRTLIHCSHAVDREIQKTIPVLIPPTAGYSILNAPLLEVSYEIVIKIRAEKTPNTVVPVPRRRQNGVRLSVPVVVVVPEDGDLEDEDEELLLATHGISAVLGSGGAGNNNMSSLGLAMGTTFSGVGLEDDFEFGDQGECPPYEVTASSGHRNRRGFF
ncbi:Arrestin domain-containing protein 3 [Mortierella sp. AD032]|nr:Arrestin domain-containing protein 3 [Mortierella sp. AD032]